MYVFRLPETIPAQGAPNGPPTPDKWRNFAGAPPGPDFRLMFLNCIKDPAQMQPTLDRIQAEFQKMAEERKKKK